MAVSELIISSLKVSIGMNIRFWTLNNFYYEGKLLGCDGTYIKFMDTKRCCIRITDLAEIKEIELK